VHGEVDPKVLLAPGSARGAADSAAPVHGRAHGEVASLALVADAPLDWLRVQSWLARPRAEPVAGSVVAVAALWGVPSVRTGGCRRFPAIHSPRVLPHASPLRR